MGDAERTPVPGGAPAIHPHHGPQTARTDPERAQPGQAGQPAHLKNEDQDGEIRIRREMGPWQGKRRRRCTFVGPRLKADNRGRASRRTTHRDRPRRHDSRNSRGIRSDSSGPRSRADQARNPVDETMIALREPIRQGFPNSKGDLLATLKPFWALRSQLTIDDRDDMIVAGSRIVVPEACRRKLLQDLDFMMHQGTTKLRQRARLTLYWPGMDRDVEMAAQSCKSCTEIMSSNLCPPHWFADYVRGSGAVGRNKPSRGW